MKLLAAGLMLCSVLSAFGAETPAGKSYSVERNIVYSSPDGVDLLLDAYLPAGDAIRPAVLVVHGGSWKSGDKNQLMGYATRLASRGIAAFAINYRLAPKHKHPAQIDDCCAALKWIHSHAKEYKVDVDRIGAIGYSAGAHLVFLLGVAGDQRQPDDPITNGPRLKAVVAGGSPVNFTVVEEDSRVLRDFLGGTKREAPDAYVNASPYYYLSSDDPPIFFFHGVDDRLVTIRGPEIAVQILKDKGVEAELYSIPKADHITAAMNLEAVQKSLDFLERHLSETPMAGR